MPRKRKRKVNYKNLVLLITLFLLLISILSASLYFLLRPEKEMKEVFTVDSLKINELDFSEMKELDIDLYSSKYILVRLNDFKVLYGKNVDDRFAPASLAKVMTMDAILSLSDDYTEVSSYTREQYNQLISSNASIAGLLINKEYTIEELLYALILPSGADGAVALENWAETKGVNLVDVMNEKAKELGLENSSFSNTTGLDDPGLYTTLSDYTKIYIDTILNEEGKKILKSASYYYDDAYAANYMVSNPVKSSLYDLLNRDDNIIAYGGKTGYTDNAGMNISILYEVDNRSYLFIGANAGGTYSQHNNFKDVETIFEYLYK